MTKGATRINHIGKKSYLNILEIALLVAVSNQECIFFEFQRQEMCKQRAHLRHTNYFG